MSLVMMLIIIDGQAHQGDNDVQGDAIRMGGGDGVV